MKTYLTFGFGMSLAGAVLTLIMHILGFWTDPTRFGSGLAIAMVLGLAINIVFLILGTRSARAALPAEVEFGYGQAFKTGLLIAFFAAIGTALFNFIYFKFINPDFGTVTAEWTRSLMERMGAPESQVERKVAEIHERSTVLRQVINGFISTIVFGTIISLITSAILKRTTKADAPAVV